MHVVVIKKRMMLMHEENHANPSYFTHYDQSLVQSRSPFTFKLVKLIYSHKGVKNKYKAIFADAISQPFQSSYGEFSSNLRCVFTKQCCSSAWNIRGTACSGLTLERSEEMLAQFLRDVILQVGGHEELEALIVNRL